MLAGALLMSGCAIYNGTSTDIPLFQEKGEWHVETAFVPVPLPLGIPVPIPILAIPFRGTVSHSLTDRVGLSVGADALRQNVQAMGGIYTPVNDHFVWELFGGLALGRGEKSDQEASYGYSGHYMMPFVQIDCGWRDLTRWMHLDVAFALRAGGIYGETRYSYPYRNELTVNNYYTPKMFFHGVRPLLEPSMEIRFGWERLKFNIRYYQIFILGNGSDRPYNLRDIPTLRGGVGLGVSYRFGGH